MTAARQGKSRSAPARLQRMPALVKRSLKRLPVLATLDIREDLAPDNPFELLILRNARRIGSILIANGAHLMPIFLPFLRIYGLCFFAALKQFTRPRSSKIGTGAVMDLARSRRDR
jgi:hypothetical protein